MMDPHMVEPRRRANGLTPKRLRQHDKPALAIPSHVHRAPRPRAHLLLRIQHHLEPEKIAVEPQRSLHVPHSDSDVRDPLHGLPPWLDERFVSWADAAPAPIPREARLRGRLQKFHRVPVRVRHHRNRHPRPELRHRHRRPNPLRLQRCDQTPDVGNRDREVSKPKPAHRSPRGRFRRRRAVELEKLDYRAAAPKPVHHAPRQLELAFPFKSERVAIKPQRRLLVAHHDPQIDRVLADLHGLSSGAWMRARATLANHPTPSQTPRAPSHAGRAALAKPGQMARQMVHRLVPSDHMIVARRNALEHRLPKPKPRSPVRLFKKLDRHDRLVHQPPAVPFECVREHEPLRPCHLDILAALLLDDPPLVALTFRWIPNRELRKRPRRSHREPPFPAHPRIRLAHRHRASRRPPPLRQMLRSDEGVEDDFARRVEHARDHELVLAAAPLCSVVRHETMLPAMPQNSRGIAYLTVKLNEAYDSTRPRSSEFPRAPPHRSAPDR